MKTQETNKKSGERKTWKLSLIRRLYELGFQERDICQPELLVFDDISSALDVQTEEKLWSRLLDKQNHSQWQPTILIVSHREWLLNRAHRVIFLDKGNITNF